MAGENVNGAVDAGVVRGKTMALEAVAGTTAGAIYMSMTPGNKRDVTFLRELCGLVGLERVHALVLRRALVFDQVEQGALRRSAAPLGLNGLGDAFRGLTPPAIDRRPAGADRRPDGANRE